MGLESPSHWVIIALVALVLFGYKKLPEMSRSVGRSLRIFKTEIKGMSQDDEARESAQVATTTQPAVVIPPGATTAATPVVPLPGAAPVTPIPGSTVIPGSPVIPAPAAEAARETPQQQTQA
jgi:sec-independent protein translocase protein TatA